MLDGMWRNVAIGLAVANLLFLAWSTWIGDAARPPVLVEPPPVALAPEPPPPPRCVTLGPFVDAALAETVAARLAAQGLAGQPREELRQQRDGYWVVIATADEATQRRTLARVRAAGTQDAYALPGDERFRISLGIFSERGRAEQRARAAERLGLPYTVEEHFVEQRVHWIDVPGAGDRLSASRLEAFGITDADVGAFDCPPVAE